MNSVKSGTAAAMRIGILGAGTVARGTLSVLTRNREAIARRTGSRIEIAMLYARNAERARAMMRQALGDSAPLVTLTSDARALLRDPSIAIVVELIGGCDAARQWVLEAIAAGKHVVTANKALLALHGEEIFAAARKQGVMVGFEAAVAGSIPVIKALREALGANQIQWLAGIINGTTNYILSAMSSRALSFDEALQEAQQAGFAEADPSFDVEGTDAAHKLCILAALAFGAQAPFARVHVEGITRVAKADIDFAAQLGYVIKLLGIARHCVRDGRSALELRVHPALISKASLLAHIEGATNAVMIRGDATGTLLFSGQGAGAEPTASAVVADIMDIARLASADPLHRVPHLAFQPAAITALPILPITDIETCFYLRLKVADEAGVLAQITALLAEHHISLDAILQRPAGEGARATDLALLTHRCPEAVLRRALAEISAKAFILAPASVIRKEDFEA